MTGELQRIWFASAIESWTPYTAKSKMACANCILFSGHTVLISDMQRARQLESYRLQYNLPYTAESKLDDIVDVLKNIRIPLNWVWEGTMVDERIMFGTRLNWPTKVT